MSIVKKLLSLALVGAMLTGLSSCSGKPVNESSDTSATDTTVLAGELETTGNETSETSATESKSPFGKAVVVYFSCSGNTKSVASKIALAARCKSYEIVPAKPYTAEDLNYNSKKSRATKEQNDASARPEIEGSISDWSSYDTVFLGYPIWFAKAPRILCTFVESYDFQGKTVIPFCTSGSSGVGASATELASLAKNGGKWIDGTRFSSSVKEKDISEWLNTLTESGTI